MNHPENSRKKTAKIDLVIFLEELFVDVGEVTKILKIGLIEN